jgi:hypothetical protein
VPCESNVVRTLSNTRAIEDQRRDDNSPINAVVAAAGQTAVQGTGNQGLGIFAPPTGDKKDKEEDDKPQVQASPAPVTGGGGPTGPFFIGASCPAGSNSCTAFGSSLPGAQVGSNVTIVTETKNPSTLATGTETFPCGPISSGPSVSCGFTTTNRIFQGGQITFTIPLAAGGTHVITQFWTCGTPLPSGTICP